MIRKTRQASLGFEGSDAPALQQLMDTMRALQEVNEEAKDDQLRQYDGCLVSFAGDQVEVRGYIELRTTFADENTAMTIAIRYIVVNVSSAYNLVLGRASLNRLRAVASTAHMRMGLSFDEGGVITIKAYQKASRKCYEISLKNRRKTYAIS